MEVSSYRPRNAGHDYYGCGTYLITLVVSGREPLLSHLIPDNGHKAATLALTPLGEAIQEAWQQIPARQLEHGNHVKYMRAYVCPTIFTAYSKCWSRCSGVLATSFKLSRLSVPVVGSRRWGFHPLRIARYRLIARVMMPPTGCVRRLPYTIMRAP